MVTARVFVDACIGVSGFKVLGFCHNPKLGLVCYRPRLQGWALHFEFRQAAAVASAGDAPAAQAHLEAAGAAAAAQGMPDLQVSCPAACVLELLASLEVSIAEEYCTAGGSAAGCSCWTM